MDRLEAMRLFTRVVERRSFSAAANDMGLPRSTATQVIQKLEKRLGCSLLQRTTRRVAPTSEGALYYQRCMAILHDVEDAESALVDGGAKGVLRIAMHGGQARQLLFPRLPEFMKAWPDIGLDISESADYVDLIGTGVDCAIRTGELRDSDLIARRLALLREVTVASPDYCARHGEPAWPEDLEDGHWMVGFNSTSMGAVLPLEFQQQGQVREVRLPMRVRVSGPDSYLGAALAGFGIIQAPYYRLRRALAAGQLVSLLEAFPPRPTPVHLVYPRSRLLSPRLRVFIDWVSLVYAAAA